MSRHSHAALFAALSILSCGVSASAETMRCQSVNGNVNCSGSGAVSCQTINGQKTCTSGHGDVVQSFGNGSPATPPAAALAAPSDDGLDADDADEAPRKPPVPVLKQRFEQHGANGHTLLLERDGTTLHLRTDWISVDRE